MTFKPSDLHEAEEMFCDDGTGRGRIAHAVCRALRRAWVEIDRLRVQLAGCGAAALGAEGLRVAAGEYGHSASYDDVFTLRARFDRQKEVIDQALMNLGCLKLRCWCFTRAAMRELPECVCDNCGVWRELHTVFEATE